MSELHGLRREVLPYARALIDALRRAGVRVTVTSVVRSQAKQRKLYNRYITGHSRLPAAPPGHSTHEQHIAWDMMLDPPVYEAAGRAWERLGGRWGGRFDDPVHFDARV